MSDYKIKLIDARRGLHKKCIELFADRKIAEAIYINLCDGIDDCDEAEKHGKWVPTHERSLFSHPDSITYVCSECGNKIYTIYGIPRTTTYCSGCGAKMEVEDVRITGGKDDQDRH